MKYTTNYNLKKPEGTDTVNINDLNTNADILDTNINSIREQINNLDAQQFKNLPFIQSDKSIGQYIKKCIDAGVQKGIFGILSTTPENPNVNQGGYIKYHCNITVNGYVIVNLRTWDNSEYTAIYLMQDGSIYKQWVKLATTKQEDWITATLQNGWTGTLQYAKNDLNEVTIRFNIMAGTITSSIDIVQLPMGYYSGYIVDIDFFNATKGKASFGLVLTSGGLIRVYAPATSDITSGDFIQGSITFYIG